MKNELDYIETSNNKYPIVFNLNVMEELQEKYGSVSKWGEKVEDKATGEPNIKDLKIGLLAMINEGIDMENEKNGANRDIVTTKQLGRILSEVGFDNLVTKIKNLTIKSTKTDESSKNA